jgi:arylsulfatase A-like enzyme
VTFTRPSEVRVRGVSVAPAQPRGDVRVSAGDIIQTGWSVADVAIQANRGARLLGEFLPPRAGEPDQRFLVLADSRDAGEKVLFRWPEQSGRAAAEPEGIELDLPLEARGGLLRLRFVALGAGSAATWSHLRVRRPPSLARPARRYPRGAPRAVVVYVMDALRADVFSDVVRDRREGPFQSLEDRSARFDLHFTTASNTPPSTEALFTGEVVVTGGGPAPDGPPTLAELFEAAGYRTAVASGNPYLSEASGLTRGFRTRLFCAVEEDHRPGARPTINRNAERVHDAALGWLSALPSDDRIFLYVHTMHPHNPYTPPAEFRRPGAPLGGSVIEGTTRTLVDIREGRVQVTPADESRIAGLYRASVAYNLWALDGFLERLFSLRDARDVLFVLTSDHGEELFDHGGVLHGFTLYDELLHVPLLMSWPGVLPPRTIETLTDTVDLHETLRTLVAQPSARPSSYGQSLWDLVQLPEAEHDGVVFAVAPARGCSMVRSKSWKLIAAPGNRRGWGMGKARGESQEREYVFDLRSDPDEARNLAGIEEPEVERMRCLLTQLTGSARTANIGAARPPVVDRETLRRLEALGYEQ